MPSRFVAAGDRYSRIDPAHQRTLDQPQWKNPYEYWQLSEPAASHPDEDPHRGGFVLILAILGCSAEHAGATLYRRFSPSRSSCRSLAMTTDLGLQLLITGKLSREVLLTYLEAQRAP